MSESPRATFDQALAQDMIKVEKVHWNTGQNVIVTTEDKLRLALQHVVDSLDRKKAWIAPVSLFTTIFLVFITTDFRQADFDAATWQAVFLICGFATLVWSIVSVFDALRVSVTIDSIVHDIKKESVELQENRPAA